MVNPKYNYETLTKALDIINRYEDNKGSVILASDIKVFDFLNMFIRQLKDYINLEYSPSQKQHLIDTFKVLTEISFDKLERDVMGVN